MTNERIRNLSGIAYIILFVALSYAALSYVRTYSKSIQPSSFRSFSAIGEGKVVSIPDVAQFSFEVITEGGKNVSDLQKTNNEKSAKAIAFVKSKGVEEKDIKTQSYSITPRYQYYNCSPVIYQDSTSTAGKPCPPPEIVGYTVSQSVVVKARKFDAVGELLTGVAANGANSVSQLTFTIDDPSSLQNKARAEAITKAQKSAKEIADAAGFKLGRILSISDSGYPSPYPTEIYGKGGRSNVSVVPAQPAPIEPGSQEITVSVTVQYEIE